MINNLNVALFDVNNRTETIVFSLSPDTTLFPTFFMNKVFLYTYTNVPVYYLYVCTVYIFGLVSNIKFLDLII